MKKGLMTIVFMVVLTMLFISTLATVNEMSKDRISRNMQMNNYKSILYAFDMLPDNVEERALGLSSTTDDIPFDEKFIMNSMETEIRKVTLPVDRKLNSLLAQSFLSLSDSVEFYVRVDSLGKDISYGFPLRGKGLWGTVSAFGVISADLNKMVGIDFTEQVETPGLGARIVESEFKYFFRNLDLSGFLKSGMETPPIIMVKQKNSTNTEKSTNALQAITGATQTVDGILKMVNTDIRFYIALIQANGDKIDPLK